MTYRQSLGAKRGGKIESTISPPRTARIDNKVSLSYTVYD